MRKCHFPQIFPFSLTNASSETLAFFTASQRNRKVHDFPFFGLCIAKLSIAKHSSPAIANLYLTAIVGVIAIVNLAMIAAVIAKRILRLRSVPILCPFEPFQLHWWLYLVRIQSKLPLVIDMNWEILMSD